MGTEHPGTERMHRLFDDTLADVDLAGDVVPGVLTGYERKVKVRRYQGAGVALAVLATAGVAVSALPHGGGAGSASVSAASTTRNQYTGYCGHSHWIASPQNSMTSSQPAPDPTAYQANCEALQTAVQAVFPTAQIVPQFNANLALDPRIDQTLLARVNNYQFTNPAKWDADTAKYFGAELKYLAVHPEDPANVYVPDQYELVTSAGRESLGVSLATDTTVPHHPEVFVGLAESNSCKNIPSVLVGKVHCTSIGAADGWHGALWDTPPGGVFAAKLTGVVTNGSGKNIELWGDGDDYQAWYHEGMYDKGMGVGAGLDGDTWINRWTGQTHEGSGPPAVHALAETQWAQLLDSPGFQKFADSYLAYLNTPRVTNGTKLPQSVPSPAHSH